MLTPPFLSPLRAPMFYQSGQFEGLREGVQGGGNDLASGNWKLGGENGMEGPANPEPL